MRIAFITSCLEPGRDGVGDYTALLASECRRTGHEVFLLALNDAHVEEENSPGLLRLGKSQKWGTRVAKAGSALAEFSPEWVSLQFVCYGFHPRGIDWRLGERLKKIIGLRPLQMMFHELWAGMENGASWKHRLAGSMQRSSMLKMVRALAPRVIHTSNPAYAGMLRQCTVDATVLPLFGNIPIWNQPVAQRTADALIFGMFGILHPEWQREPLLGHLRATGKKITIIHAGRMSAGEAIWEKMTRDHAEAFEFQRIGEQPPARIAEFLSRLDFGIATTPWELVGKSGTVAAMLEHGLPVIVNRDDVHYTCWHEEGYSNQLIKMDDDLPARIATAKRVPPHGILPATASQFLADMERRG